MFLLKALIYLRVFYFLVEFINLFLFLLYYLHVDKYFLFLILICVEDDEIAEFLVNDVDLANLIFVKCFK
jgi:hypothetical protein